MAQGVIGTTDEKFIDTSILVYAYNNSDMIKHEAIKSYIKEILSHGERPIISLQVLLEFYNVITRKISNPIKQEDAAKIVGNFFDADDWIKLGYSNLAVSRAITYAAKAKLVVWDVLIAETMREHGIYKIITENERDFKKIKDLEVINPFKKRYS